MPWALRDEGCRLVSIVRVFGQVLWVVQRRGLAQVWHRSGVRPQRLARQMQRSLLCCAGSGWQEKSRPLNLGSAHGRAFPCSAATIDP